MANEESTICHVRLVEGFDQLQVAETRFSAGNNIGAVWHNPKCNKYVRTVVFHLFYTAAHFATQFHLTPSFQKFPVGHMKCSCVCTIENHD